MQDSSNLENRQYVQGWNNPYFVVPIWMGWWLTGLFGGTVALYLLLGGTVSWVVNATPLSNFVIVVIFYGACAGMLIQGTGFDFEKIPKAWCKTFSYETISTISPSRYSGSFISVQVTTIQGEKICIPRMGSRFGALLERLLPLCTNLQSLDLADYPSRITAWGKAPDWTIISAAKACAEGKNAVLKKAFSAHTNMICFQMKPTPSVRRNTSWMRTGNCAH